MLELLEQIEPHTYRKNYSIKNIRSSKINISTHSHRSPSEAILKEVETSMFKFLWNCKPDKIQRDQIIQDYNDGGLKMRHFKFKQSFKGLLGKTYTKTRL